MLDIAVEYLVIATVAVLLVPGYTLYIIASAAFISVRKSRWYARLWHRVF